MNPPVVDVHRLSYTYPDGRLALVEVSFALAAGETVALVGPNGAGKSTLLLHLNGVLPEWPRPTPRHATDNGRPQAEGACDAAVVRIAGLVLGPQTLPTIRHKVGLLFQDPDDQLFCPTVVEDVAFGPLNFGKTPTEAREVALRCLEAVGLPDHAERVTHRLSVGEKKRVCLAGVLACEPEVLALDEPTSHLDPRGRRRFIELIGALPQAKLIATHDLEMVLELCSRTIVIDEGRIWADGPTRHVLSQAPMLADHGLEVPLSLRRRLG